MNQSMEGCKEGDDLVVMEARPQCVSSSRGVPRSQVQSGLSKFFLSEIKSITLFSYFILVLFFSFINGSTII